jgi:hypothetical protein
MVQTEKLKKVAVAAAITAGFMSVTTPGVTAPAHAAPGCVEWGWPVANTLLASGGVRLNGEPAATNDDWSLSWTGQESGAPLSVGTATLTGFRDKPPLTANVTGSLTPGGNGGTLVHITWFSQDNTMDLILDGGISPEGNVIGSSEAGGGKISWRMAGPFVCKTLGDAVGATAPKADPTITSDEVIGGLIVHVKNNTPDTTKCHYDSEVIDRDFTLNPNATTDLNLVPAVPLLRTWPVTVTCDNGAKGTADIDF